MRTISEMAIGQPYLAMNAADILGELTIVKRSGNYCLAKWDAGVWDNEAIINQTWVNEADVFKKYTVLQMVDLCPTTSK